ncbi:hypothetical protein K501DRAFT_237160 [Backusella circina FSU 941]|nr:hypothetical protein K501DRAFT_237160 [Backusella circina FSU 941]
MAPLKIIGAGFGRTSTDSLRHALDILGYNTHHMKSIFQDPDQDMDDFYYAAKNNGQDVDWDKIYKKYDAAVDWPTCTFYKQLMEKYPDAKVILTVRSADSWYQSAIKTLHVHYIHPDFNSEFAQKFKRMVGAVILNGTFNDPEKAHREEEVKKMFSDHIEEVKRHVPPEKLYVMQVGEGWEGLCQFLGKEIPDVPYPRINSKDEFLKNMENFNKNF